MAIQRLTAAYRSRSRPSSTLGAKASTMCPYYLDGDLLGRALRLCPVIPVSLATVQFSRSAKRRNSPPGGPGPVHRAAGGEPVSQNSTACGPPRRGRLPVPCDLPDSVDILVAGRAQRRAPRSSRAQATILRRPVPSRGGLPRKEVIQPQLPLRLPCYDFTPVTSPTFDGSLPKGLGHRLRVLLTPMV